MTHLLIPSRGDQCVLLQCSPLVSTVELNGRELQLSMENKQKNNIFAQTPLECRGRKDNWCTHLNRNPKRIGVSISGSQSMLFNVFLPCWCVFPYSQHVAISVCFSICVSVFIQYSFSHQKCCSPCPLKTEMMLYQPSRFTHLEPLSASPFSHRRP